MADEAAWHLERAAADRRAQGASRRRGAPRPLQGARQARGPRDLPGLRRGVAGRALARNTESRERSEHPLQRIMDVEEAGDAEVIRTTGIHLLRRIGHALVDAYKGELETHYDEAGHFLRVTWRREA